MLLLVWRGGRDEDVDVDAEDVENDGNNILVSVSPFGSSAACSGVVVIGPLKVGANVVDAC